MVAFFSQQSRRHRLATLRSYQFNPRCGTSYSTLFSRKSLAVFFIFLVGREGIEPYPHPRQGSILPLYVAAHIHYLNWFKTIYLNFGGHSGNRTRSYILQVCCFPIKLLAHLFSVSSDNYDSHIKCFHHFVRHTPDFISYFNIKLVLRVGLEPTVEMPPCKGGGIAAIQPEYKLWYAHSDSNRDIPLIGREVLPN